MKEELPFTVCLMALLVAAGTGFVLGKEAQARKDRLLLNREVSRIRHPKEVVDPHYEAWTNGAWVRLQWVGNSNMCFTSSMEWRAVWDVRQMETNSFLVWK